VLKEGEEGGETVEVEEEGGYLFHHIVVPQNDVDDLGEGPRRREGGREGGRG
jgi:hypothetical protein